MRLPTPLHESNGNYWHLSLRITLKVFKRGQNNNANGRFEC